MFVLKKISAAGRYAALFVLIVIFFSCSRAGFFMRQPEIKEGGILVIGIPGKIDLFINFEDTHNIKTPISAIYETLVAFYPGQEGPRPLLAESWAISQDRLQYTINIKRGIVFHDKTVLTASVVASALEHLKQNSLIIPGPENLSHIIPANIKSIQVINDYSLNITLVKPDPFFLVSLADVSNSIRKKPAPQFAVNNIPVGTGPFKIASINNSGVLITDRFEEYRGAYPHIERVVFRFIDSANATVLALKSGDIDILKIPNKFSFEKISADSNFKTVSGFSGKALFLFFNPQSSFFSKEELRLSVISAINRTSFKDNVFKFKPVIGADNFPYLFRFTSTGGRIYYDSDMAGNLRQNYAPPGNTSVNGFFWLKDNELDNQSIVFSVSEYFKSAGYLFNILSKESIDSGITDDIIVAWHSVYSNPEFYGSNFTGKNYAGNFKNYSENFASIMYDALTAEDQESATYLYSQAESLISDELPWFPIVCEAEIYSAAKKVMGLTQLPDGRLNMTELWLNQ